MLDLGCGNGMIAEYIADQTGAHITGIDFIERAIHDAQVRTAGKRERLEFRVMDMSRLDFPPASFDVVIAIDTLYFTDIDETLRPMIPMLRAGGRLVAFFDQSCGPDKPLESYPRELILPDGTELAQALQRLGLSYQTWDYTEPMLAHLRRRRPVLAGSQGAVRGGRQPVPLRQPSRRGERHRAGLCQRGRTAVFVPGAVACPLDQCETLPAVGEFAPDFW